MRGPEGQGCPSGTRLLALANPMLRHSTRHQLQAPSCRLQTQPIPSLRGATVRPSRWRTPWGQQVRCCAGDRQGADPAACCWLASALLLKLSAVMWQLSCRGLSGECHAQRWLYAGSCFMVHCLQLQSVVRLKRTFHSSSSGAIWSGATLLPAAPCGALICTGLVRGKTPATVEPSGLGRRRC